MEKTKPLKAYQFLIRKSKTILSLFKLQKERGAWTAHKMEAANLNKLPEIQYKTKTRKT